MFKLELKLIFYYRCINAYLSRVLRFGSGLNSTTNYNSLTAVLRLLCENSAVIMCRGGGGGEKRACAEMSVYAFRDDS